MAFKLTKEEAIALKDHVATLADKLEIIRTAEAERQTQIKQADEAVQAALSNYNGALEDAHQFVADTANRLRGEFDDKSEKWQEGERAAEIASLIEEWENAELDEVPESETSEPEMIDAEHSETLDGLPEGAE